MIAVKKIISLIVFTFAFVLISGCGGKSVVPIKGTVVLPDDIVLKGQDSVQLLFHPADATAVKGSARVAPKMSSDPKAMAEGAAGPIEPFIVMAGADKGLAAGSYKVTAKVEIYGAMGGGGGPGGPGAPPGMDDSPTGMVNAKYSQLNSTPLKLEVTSGTKEIVVDLKAGTITVTGSK